MTIANKGILLCPFLLLFFCLQNVILSTAQNIFKKSIKIQGKLQKKSHNAQHQIK